MDVHPSAEELDRWLQNELQEGEDQAIADHISQCKEVCQAYLDRLIPFTHDADINSPVSHRRSIAPGDSIAGYEILEEIGHGGMGVVYRAWSRRLGRVVALKMLVNAARREPRLLLRFRQEIESAGRLSHPNIIAILDSDVEDGVPFLVMELADQKTLAAKLSKQPLAPREAAKLSVLLAEACEHAHAHGILHRDLKPPNILLSACKRPESEPGSHTGPAWSIVLDGHLVIPKIADFGLAKIADGETDSASGGLTSLGDRPGTPSYMAPEQAGGGKPEVGPTADVYALGAVLYEMLTGRPPFKAASALETLHQIVHDDVVLPSRLQPTTPADLDTICLKCLEKSPNHRYASARDLAADLERFLAGKRTMARPRSVLSQSLRWCRRHPNGVGIIAIILLAFGGVAWEWRQAEFARQDAESRESQLEELVDQMIQSSPLIRLRERNFVNAPKHEPLQNVEWQCEQLLERRPNNYRLRIALTRVQAALADLQINRGNAAEADAYLHRARDSWRALAVQDSGSSENRRWLAITEGWMAAWLAGRGQYANALDSFLQADSLWIELNDKHPNDQSIIGQTLDGRRRLIDLFPVGVARGDFLDPLRQRHAELEKLVLHSPSNRFQRQQLAFICLLLGEWHNQPGSSVGEAAPFWRQAAEHYSVLDDGDQNLLIDVPLALCSSRLARTNSLVSWSERSMARYAKIIAALENLEKLHPHTIWIRETLLRVSLAQSMCQWEAGDATQAVRIYQSQLQCLDSLLRSPITDPAPKVYLLDVVSEFAVALRKAKRSGMALEVTKDLATRLRMLIDFPDRDCISCGALASRSLGVAFLFGQLDEPNLALPYAKEGLRLYEILEQATPDAFPLSGHISSAWERLGKIHLQLHQPKDALESFRHASFARRQQFLAEPQTRSNRTSLSKSYRRVFDSALQSDNRSEAAAALGSLMELWQADAAELLHVARDFDHLASRIGGEGTHLSLAEQKERQTYQAESERVKRLAEAVRKANPKS